MMFLNKKKCLIVIVGKLQQGERDKNTSEHACKNTVETNQLQHANRY